MTITNKQRALSLLVGALLTLTAIGLKITAQPTEREWNSHVEMSERKIGQLDEVRQKVTVIETKLDGLLVGVAALGSKVDKLDDGAKSWLVPIFSFLGGGGFTFGAISRKKKLA